MRNAVPIRGVDPASLLRWAAFCHGALPAVDDGRREVDFQLLLDRGERLANAFDALGIPESGTVGILSENRTEYIEADVGIALGRRVRVALNARLHLEDHRFVAEDSAMRVLIHSSQFAETAAALRAELGLRTVCFDGRESGDLEYDDLLARSSSAPVSRPGDSEDPAWITYTSGTTGRPKGIVLSQRSIREVAFNLLVELGPVQPGDRIVLPQPLSHGAGYFALPWLLSGAGLYVMSRFDPDEALGAALPDRTNTFKCVPAMLPPLLEAVGGKPFGYEAVVYGAAPIPRPVLDAALDRLGPLLIQIYGQSEAPVTLSCLQKCDHEGNGDQRFSAGRPFRPVAIEVRGDDGQPLAPGAEGEVAVTGSHLMSRYHKLPDATAEVMRDGWIMTKDMGVFDERGFLYLRGRRDEMINSGGFNISPREVEQVLSGFPGVEEVVVVGLPDERWGQAVGALVKMRGVDGASPEAMIAFAHPRLGFRTPKNVAFIDAIPKNAYGKVDRKGVLSAFLDIETASA